MNFSENSTTNSALVREGFEYQKPLHFNTADNVARLLMVVNSSVNFLIYSVFSKSFQVRIHLLTQMGKGYSSHFMM